MKFKKMILTLSITGFVIFALALGSVYAYYNASESANLDITSPDASPVTVVFNNSEYIRVNTAIPILSTQVESEANKHPFSIVIDSSYLEDYEIALRSSLFDISIDSALMVNDFKYKLVCLVTDTDSNENLVTKISGDGTDFSELENNELILFNETLTNEASYSCNVYVWLEENNQNQNALMDKHFAATVKVDTVMRKKDKTNE